MVNSKSIEDIVREVMREMLRERIRELIPSANEQLRNHDVVDEPQRQRSDRDSADRRAGADRRRAAASDTTSTAETVDQGNDPHQRRRRRLLRRGPRVAYVVIRTPRARKDPSPELPPGNITKAWEWLLKHEPATAKDIERGTGMKQKAVESAVYFLRQIKAIASKEI